MSPIAKLAGFAVVLLLVFGGAALAGGAIGPERDDDSAAARDGGHTDSDASHGGEPAAGKDSVSTHTSEKTESEATRDAVRGLAVADNGLELALQQTELPRGRETELGFSIVGADGQPVRDFEVEHEKRMHLIVVRRDGEGFQHLHPELGADGIWRVRATVPQAGAYRVFADFKRGEQAQTLAADLAVDGNADYRPVPAPATTADTGDGYQVLLDAGGCAPGARPSCASPSPATARPSTPSPTWAPAGTSWRCARATSPTCTCTRAATASPRPTTTRSRS